MDMTPGSKHNDEHDEAQKKVFRGYGFRPGGKNEHNRNHKSRLNCAQNQTKSSTNRD